MAEYEFGLFTNPHVSRAVAEEDTGILWLRPAGAGFVDIIPPTHSRRQRFPKRLIVRGGDGSMREICQWMNDRGEFRPIGLLPGGSQNVLYNALLELGLTSDVKAFLEKETDDYPEDQILRPGMVGNLVFVNHVGFGHFEQHLGEYNKRLRFLPNGRRTLVAALISLVRAACHPNRKEDILNLYTITPTIGQIPAFPEQNLLDGNLTHARVVGVRSLVTTLLYWQMGKAAPDKIMPQLSGSSFAVPPTGNYIWLDGDTVPYVFQEGTLIRRASYGIPMVAII